MKKPAKEVIPMGEHEFRELADHVPVLIWRSRTDKLCDWFNKPWQEFSGKSLEALFGYGWAEDVHPEDFDRCVATYVSAFDKREPFTMPYRLRRHDGVYRWFLDNGAPFYRNGEFAGYFSSCIDITEQRELQEHQCILLAELNHRVKNNLQLIMSFLQLSKMRATSDEAKTLLQAAVTRVQGVGLVQEELFRSASSDVNLADYLAGLARSALSLESGDRLTLATEMQAVPVPRELASNLGLIVNELITNAIKHGNGTSKVLVSVRKVDDKIAEIRVADDGAGFPETVLAARDKKDAIRGNGLIDALARRCGAEVKRENHNGAVVSLRFPLAAKAPLP